LRNVIVSGYVTLFQINKFFVTIPFHFDKMASRAAFSSRAVVWKPLVYSHFQYVHVYCVCIKRKNSDPRENEKLRKCKISYEQLTFYRETDCDKLSAIRLNFAEAVSLYFYLKIHSSQCIFFNYSNYRKKHIGSFFEFMYKCTSSRNADCIISKICPMGR